MELIHGFIDLIVHLDRHLLELVSSYGGWVYAILFVIVFCETGLVVTPFLPGDSLLFVAGTIAGAGSLNVHLLVVLLTLAAVVGDSLNYAIGHYLGPKVFRFEDSWFFKQAYVEKTHAYFERYGGRTIVIARFLPIVRTYAPFVAGIGRMDYGQFLLFNIAGAVLWVVLLTYAGYFFGNLPLVKNNLSLVILGIIILSISPGIIEVARHKLRAQGSRAN
jgi:membrane-associated protein